MKLPVSVLGKKISPIMRLAAAIIIAVLLLFTAIRTVSWYRRTVNARLLTVVNAWNPVSETGYTAKLMPIENGLQVDRACESALREMLNDCRAAGCSPVVLYA